MKNFSFIKEAIKKGYRYVNGVFYSYTGCENKIHLTDRGYAVISISVNAQHKLVKLHHFVWVLNGGTDCTELNHVDGNKQNNEFVNLEVSSRAHNINHAIRTGLLKIPYGEKCGKSKLNTEQITEIFKLRKKGLTYKTISSFFNVHYTTIGYILTNKTWRQHDSRYICSHKDSKENKSNYSS